MTPRLLRLVVDRDRSIPYIFKLSTNTNIMKARIVESYTFDFLEPLSLNLVGSVDLKMVTGV